MPLLTAVSGLVDFAQRQLDRLIPPESRHKACIKTKDFAAQRPLLFVCSSTPLETPNLDLTIDP
jgi:hypothetical protein